MSNRNEFNKLVGYGFGYIGLFLSLYSLYLNTAWSKLFALFHSFENPNILINFSLFPLTLTYSDVYFIFCGFCSVCWIISLMKHLTHFIVEMAANNVLGSLKVGVALHVRMVFYSVVIFLIPNFFTKMGLGYKTFTNVYFISLVSINGIMYTYSYFIEKVSTTELEA